MNIRILSLLLLLISKPLLAEDTKSLLYCRNRVEELCKMHDEMEAILRCGWIVADRLSDSCAELLGFAFKYYVSITMIDDACKKTWLLSRDELASCENYKQHLRPQTLRDLDAQAKHRYGMSPKRVLAVLSQKLAQP